MIPTLKLVHRLLPFAALAAAAPRKLLLAGPLNRPFLSRRDAQGSPDRSFRI
jgi:hypothetical protein